MGCPRHSPAAAARRTTGRNRTHFGSWLVYSRAGLRHIHTRLRPSRWRLGTFGMPGREPSGEGGRIRAHQSDPRGIPSLGVWAFDQVVDEIPLAMPRTLPSAKLTKATSEWPLVTRSGSANSGG